MSKREDYFNEFVEKLKCQYSSEATIRNYSCIVKSFLFYCLGLTENKPQILLRKYILDKLKDNESKTINLHRAAIIKFFKLVKGISITCNDVPRRKESKKLPKIISQDKIQLAISKTMNLKHRLELMLFYCCGLRLCEIARLKRKNVILENNTLWLQDTKGNKERIVPIPKSVQNLLYMYIENFKPEQLVFGEIVNRTFQKVVGHAFDKIGIHATPHMLRHSFATHQIMSGQSPFKVQSWLGHSSIQTTQTYVHLSRSCLMKSSDLLETKIKDQDVVINENYMNKSSYNN
jgi:integrase